MSTSIRHQLGTNATSADCARLWSTLTTEYISKLRIEVGLDEGVSGQASLLVEVVDSSLIVSDGELMVNVWASRIYYNPLYLISSGQLFDLLITAYRNIDDYFTYGENYSPNRRKV